MSEPKGALMDYRRNPPPEPAPTPEIYLAETEAGLVGGLIRDAEELPEVRSRVSAEMFYGVKYRMIWNAILDLADADEPIDTLTVIERLDRDGSIGAKIAMADIAQIVLESPSAANVKSYAAMVASRHQRRVLQALGGEAAKWAETEPDPAKVVARIQEQLEKVGVEREENGPKALGALMEKSLEILDHRASQPPGRTGLPTGLDALDDLIDGLCPGRLYVVAARPGVGKSILGLQFARCAIHAGKSAGLWSLEMPNDEVVCRLWAAERDISFRKIQTAHLQPNDWAALNDVSAQLKDHKLWIDDTESLQLAELLSRIRTLHRRNSLDLVVIDYLGLIRGPKSQNREQEISQVVIALKGIAKKLKIPVVVLAQLNRILETRNDKRPQASDLRESGAVEQTADVIIMLYRDELYNEQSADINCMEILIRKQRAGPLGMVPGHFRGSLSRIDPLPGGLPSKGGPLPSTTTNPSTWP